MEDSCCLPECNLRWSQEQSPFTTRWRPTGRIDDMADPVIAKGAVARKIGEPSEIEDIEVPAPGPGEARVRIVASGVCHTDLSAKNGVFCLLYTSDAADDLTRV